MRTIKEPRVGQRLEDFMPPRGRVKFCPLRLTPAGEKNDFLLKIDRAGKTEIPGFFGWFDPPFSNVL